MTRRTKQYVWYVDADQAGAGLLLACMRMLERAGDTIVDVGAAERRPRDDYPRAAARVVRALRTHPDAFGLLACGSGNGMAMAANRFLGIRAALAPSPRYARKARQDEDANVLVLPAWWVPANVARAILTAWRTAKPSAAARHKRRRAQLDRLAHD